MAGALPQNRGNRSSNRVGASTSRRLRAAGWNVSPSARKYKYDGIFVSGSDGRATVLVDLGLTTKNARVASAIAEEAMAWPQVSEVKTEAQPDGHVFVWVTYSN